MLMQDASWQNQVMLQWISDSPTAHEIDSEIGTLGADFLGGKALLKYLRYNFPITEEKLNGLGFEQKFNSEDVASLVEMSNAGNRQLLYEIGTAASETIQSTHFD